MNLKSKIESILFVASRPLTIKKIAKELKEKESDIQDVIEQIKEKFDNPESGIHLIITGDQVQFSTNSDNAEFVEKFIKSELMGELTRAQLETLTVIAYQEPITRPEIEQIRGVNCAVILRNLMQRGLLGEEGSEALMPVYRLSVKALQHLGVSSPQELPDHGELHGHDYLEVRKAGIGDQE